MADAGVAGRHPPLGRKLADSGRPSQLGSLKLTAAGIVRGEDPYSNRGLIGDVAELWLPVVTPTQRALVHA